MESKEYFEKVMQDFNQRRGGRSLRKYCNDEGIDYDWVIKFKKTYPSNESVRKEERPQGFIPILVGEDRQAAGKWEVERLVLKSPEGGALEIKAASLFAVAELLHKMS